MTCLLGGDEKWMDAHRELRALHIRKSATYGRDGDRFANFTAVAYATGKPPEYYVALRMIEKLARTVNMIDAGDADSVKEWADLASLGLCGEALRRRRV